MVHGEPVVFLHIGAPKSGTTYLQSRLSTDPGAAAEQGLLWAVPWGRHVEAAREVKQLRVGQSLAPHGAWRRLAREASEWRGRSVLISMEWLMNAQDHQVAAAVASFAPARVEVMCTARDLTRTLPGAWQESMQNFRTWPWDEYTREVMIEGSTYPGAVEFWSQQEIPPVLWRWGAHVGLDRVHLVTVPPGGSDPRLLWDRFCDVLGLEGDAFAEPADLNPSLGAVSASLMQRFNVGAKEQKLSHQDYVRFAKQMLAKEVLASRRGREPAIPLSDELRHYLKARAERMVAELRDMPVHLVGDLGELVPTDTMTTGRDPSEITEAEMFDAAVEGLMGLVGSFAAHDRRLRQVDVAGRVDESSRKAAATLVRAMARRVKGLLPAGRA